MPIFFSNTTSNFRTALHFSLESRHTQGLANCPAIGIEELVYDTHCEDVYEEEIDQRNITFGPRINDANDVKGQRCCIAYEECLVHLARLAVGHRCELADCSARIDISCKTVGTAMLIDWVCENGHKPSSISRWRSQPLVNGMRLGDLTVAANTLYSGNNFRKIQFFFKCINAGCISESSFLRIQRLYAVPSVNEMYSAMQNSALEKFHGHSVIVMGDGRNDSPGHSAMYCTYTVVECESLTILAVVVVDKRHVGKRSTNMEKEALVRAMSIVREAGIKVVEVVTDAHSQIAKYIRTQHPSVKHSFDVWHGAKNLCKKLNKASTPAKCSHLRPWIRDIVDHFWYCCQHCDGSLIKLQGLWKGVLHHVRGVHEWYVGDGGPGCCLHEEMPDNQPTGNKEWMTTDSPAFVAMRKVVLDPYLIRTLPHYINFRWE
ncbi:PREDICTED: uncharacterized protein LOC106808111 [Priapulus caudatus]|uniref:Uncharacterized protein LOC106808111 n=1 Tax=Priapulus caudatus TaxID=37621 RepID=A0ABM1E1V1_PRICU|nr:PREDICTED: uncharacterized protein LOC106808111 [Priapulus caudatus]